MVKIQKTYKNKKTGEEVQFKTPRVKFGTNMGEEDPETLEITSEIYTRDVTWNNKGKKETFTTYGCYGKYKGQDVYAELTPVTAQKIMELDYMGRTVIFERVLKDGRNFINFKFGGDVTPNIKEQTKPSLTKDDIMKIFTAEKKDSKDIINFEGKDKTFEEILGKEVIALLRS